jgi:chromatin segregation and condensation protein Rec8/ScpA/Scc1 (kleisin family)
LTIDRESIIFGKLVDAREGLEPKDLDLIQRLIEHHEELKILMEEHRAMERELDKYLGKRYLTPSEEIEKKRIQKLKLAGKDRIEAILAQYRRQGCK